MKIDFLIPVRDRDLPRIQHCIDSIQGDSVGEIYIIDYGSKEPIEMEGVTVLRVPKIGFMTWNKAHALNLGLKEAKSEYIGTIDCDIILPDNFIDEAAKVLDQNTFVLSNNVRRIDAFDGDFESSLNKSFPWHDEISNYQKAVGGIQIFPRDWIIRHQGYDESLTYWNGVDTYIYEVAIHSGLNVKNLPLNILHQEHEFKKEENLSNDFEKEVARRAMRGRSATVTKLAKEAARRAIWGEIERI